MKQYGSYTSEDLDNWERLPMQIQVLTSSAFGAWLRRRDERIEMKVIEDIKADLDKRYDEVKPYDIQYASGLEEALEIIERHCGGDNE